ncbi:hypothetical protein BU17DRAFT_72573, partial [Hysterangium stoloniferum]
SSHTAATSLCDQPEEILEAIISEIENPQHLLHLALTQKRFRDLIIPWHIRYRVIFAKISDIGLWEHLASRRDLASRVHMLDITTREHSLDSWGRQIFVRRYLRDDQSYSATELSEEEQASCLANFRAALRLMVNLDRFFISSGFKTDFVSRLDFANTLKQIVPRHIQELCLRGFDVSTNSLNEWLQIFHFAYLTQLSITVNPWDPLPDNDQNLLTILCLAPRLRDLCINIPYSQLLLATLRNVLDLSIKFPDRKRVDLDQFLSQLYKFPNLRCLSVRDGFFRSSDAIVIGKKVTEILTLLEGLRVEFYDENNNRGGHRSYRNTVDL